MQCLYEFFLCSLIYFSYSFACGESVAKLQYIAATDSAKTNRKNSRNAKTKISFRLLLNSRGVHVVIEALGRHPSDRKTTLGFSLVNVVDHDVTRETKVCHLQACNIYPNIL